ncbi:MAG: hypothetical protein ACK5O9_07485, partial [Holosporales bacterium]
MNFSRFFSAAKTRTTDTDKVLEPDLRALMAVIAEFQGRLSAVSVELAVDTARRASLDYPAEFLSELISALAAVTDNPALSIEFVFALQGRQRNFC